MAKRYSPPRQSGIGQFVDCIFLIVLVYASLMAPLLLHFGGNQAAATAEKPAATQPVSWQSLHQNKAMQGQWEKLGYTPEKAAELINQRFDYTIDPISLGVTAAILLAYWIFVLRYSEREYRDVIAEHFDRNRQ